jgi:hypothetical protein
VFHFSPTDVETLVLHPDNPTRHIHHKANSIGSGNASTSPDYLRAVAESVSDAGSVLITGPANARRVTHGFNAIFAEAPRQIGPGSPDSDPPRHYAGTSRLMVDADRPN